MIADDLAMEQDPARRVVELAKIQKFADATFRWARDKAAWDLRSQFTSRESARRVGMTREAVDTWARRWSDRKGLSGLKRASQKTDWSHAIDLSGQRGSSQSTPPPG